MAVSKATLAAAFHEEKVNPPAILAKTARKYGAKRANAQRVAIAFSKARRGDVPTRNLTPTMTRMKV